MSNSVTRAGSAHTRNLVFVWAFLVLLTLVSWWFRENSLSAELAVAVIIAISFVKVFLVGFSFMELQFAPQWLRFSFDGWCVTSTIILIGMALLL